MGCFIERNQTSDFFYEQQYFERVELSENLRSFQFKGVPNSFPLTPHKILT